MSELTEIENAASAFQTAMDGDTPRGRAKESGSSEGRGTANMESMFDNLNKFTDDGDDEAGGDYIPDPEAPVKKTAKKPVDDEDEGDEGDEDNEYDNEDGMEFELDDDGNVVLGEDGLPVLKQKEDSDDDDDESQVYKVMVDGEEVEVPLDEALAGYIRQETFHRRLNNLDQIRVALGEEAERTKTVRQAVIDAYTEMEEQAKVLIPTEPDWDALYSEDPVKARQIEKNYKDILAKVGDVKSKREKIQAEQAKEEADQLAAFARSEFPKFVQSAKWKTDKQMKNDMDAMRNTAAAQGFTPEEIAGVIDSRMLGILLKAARYDKLVASRPIPAKVGEKRGKTSGAGKRTAPKGMDRAKSRLNRTGSIEDAAAVFAQHLK